VTTKTYAASEKLTPERWHRLKTILADALENETKAARATFVQRACVEDPTLLRDAESLLSEAEAMLTGGSDEIEQCAENATAAIRADDGSQIGRRLGAYVIVRELGRGGMGAVYLAERADGQFEKQVAIKLLKRGTDTDEILRRFRTERQILAKLDHPNVARLLDAGTTDEGLPYFVMEYVVGLPLIRFADERGLSLQDRLQLFLKVCAAVEAAHRKLIVHRDLKSTNILVSEDGEPKLLDFGIAKLLEPSSDAADLTALGQERLTPRCASPEQVRGEPATPATDIYALGALLYEMVAGKAPHRFSTPNPPFQEIARVVSDEPPLPPSMACSDESLRVQLRSGLDEVILAALEKKPDRRYGSVAEFEERIRGYLPGKLTTSLKQSDSSSAQDRSLNRRRLAAATIAAVSVIAAVVAGIIWFNSRTQPPSASLTDQPRNPLTTATDKSIAVLPFQNLSEEKENAFFADGVQDAILADLAKVADLKVISRTSVAPYGSNGPRDVTAIGQQLKVANLLQGSVQRAGNRVRVSAQLLDAQTNAQLWADTYDRDLADVFAIQSEIAEAIVRQLRARLLPSEKSDIEAPPTRDIAAYGLYLQANEIVNGYLDAADPGASLRQAIRLLDEAIRRDPDFTLAYCYTARAHSLLFALGLDLSPTRPRQAREALDVALRLQPDSPEAHMAVAEWHYRCFLAHDSAQKEIAIARPGLPNSTPFYVLAGNVCRRQARWDEAEADFKKAAELDPRNPNAVNFLADTQILMRKFPEAVATYERAQQAGLDNPILAVRIAIIDFAATGNTAKLRAALGAAPPDLDVGGGETPLRIMIALAERDYDGARRALAASPRDSFQDVDFSFYYPRAWYEGVIARAAGDSETARKSFAAALNAFEAMNGVGRARARGVVAQAYAALGQKEQAIGEAIRAAKAIPTRDDAYLGPLILQSLAQVYTWTDEKDRAIDLIEQLVREPGYLTYGLLLVDRSWDPLRGEPRFEKLLASLAPHDIKRQ
jgi:serine/threonine protein kinase/Tfp pilus assembly protein PilF